jgi:large subunit ribosomal protein L15
VKLSDLRPAPGSHKTEKRLGRGHGSGRGKTAGRGTKGQKARTGGKVHRAFNGGQTRLSKRLPFVRGLGNNTTPFRDNYTIINVLDLSLFESGSEVRPEDLVNGDLDHALTVHAHKVSESARVKIEAAGGSIEIIPTKVYEKTKRRKEDKTTDKTTTETQQG